LQYENDCISLGCSYFPVKRLVFILRSDITWNWVVCVLLWFIMVITIKVRYAVSIRGRFKFFELSRWSDPASTKPHSGSRADQRQTY
jgi:hypothetical protein